MRQENQQHVCTPAPAKTMKKSLNIMHRYVLLVVAITIVLRLFIELLPEPLNLTHWKLIPVFIYILKFSKGICPRILQSNTMEAYSFIMTGWVDTMPP